jgi:hypothetical protein
MEKRVGITEAQARKLLELAKNSNRPCVVKTINKDIRSEPGRAILKEIRSNGTAVILPFKHKHTEEEVLSNIFFWKSGCDFDITEAMDMQSTIDYRKPLGEKLSIPTSVVASGTPVGEFVIFSRKMKSVWAGNERRWTDRFNLANRWKNHHEGMRAVERINKVPMQNDAVLLPIDEAHQALLSVLASSQQPKQITPQSLDFKATMSPPTPHIPRPTAPSISAPKPQSVSAVGIDDDDDFINLNILLGRDNDSLRLAEEERKKAGAQYGLARKAAEAAQRAVEEAKQLFAELDQKVQSLGGASALKGKTRSRENGDQNRKPIMLRSRIHKMLMSNLRLQSSFMYKQISSEIQGIKKSKIDSALSSMKRDDLAEKNEDGWSLTLKGRQLKSREN